MVLGVYEQARSVLEDVTAQWAGYYYGCAIHWCWRGDSEAAVGSGSACGGETGQRGHEADGGAAEEGRAGNSRLEKLADEYTVVGLDIHTDIQVHMCSLRMVERDHGRVALGLGRGFNKFLMRLFASARFPGKCVFWAQQLACATYFRAFCPSKDIIKNLARSVGL